MDGAPVFAALGCGSMVDVDGATAPTVVIDASEHPEIADLARVHVVEGIGDIWTEAIRSESLLLLGVRVTVPVVATFAIAFDVEVHGAFLGEVADHETLVIAHTDPARADVDRPHWLAIDLDGDALRRCLADG